MGKKMNTRQTAEYLMIQIEDMRKRGLLFTHEDFPDGGDEKLVDEILEWLWLIANDR